MEWIEESRMGWMEESWMDDAGWDGWRRAGWMVQDGMNE